MNCQIFHHLQDRKKYADVSMVSVMLLMVTFPGRCVILDVGGERFTAMRQLLESRPDTR